MSDSDKTGLYAAFKAKDTRFDGRFFVGISSTGIYCRPICHARQAKIENCTFYTTAAGAEQAGYRPCLLCRPELAPGKSVTDASVVLAGRAARILEENCAGGESIEALAGRLGCTDRHLRRVFKAEYKVTPVQYLQTSRLLLAKSLLTDTNLSVLDVAMATGFGSLRRFNDLFKERYKLSPTTFRKSLSEEKKQSKDITLLLAYRPPYRFEEILNFLAGQAIPGVELVTDKEYARTVSLTNRENKQISGWIRVGHVAKKKALSVTLSETLLPVLPQALAKIRHLFDLNCDPEAVYGILESMNDISPGLCILGTRLPGSFSSFETAVRTVLGQQMTAKAANTLAGRLVVAYGTPVNSAISGLTHVFPFPHDILALGGQIEDSLVSLGINGTQARIIYRLAEIFWQGHIDFEFCIDPEGETEKLLAIPGIERWTAYNIAMRTMGWTDAFLDAAPGINKVLEPYSYKEMARMAENWRPWRSYAIMNIWNSL